MAISPQLKAQTRVNDGQYTSPVSFNWADSVKKYQEITDYYVNYKSFDGDIAIIYYNKWQYYQHLIDSYERQKQEIIDSLNNIAIKQKLEIKYKIKLP